MTASPMLERLYRSAGLGMPRVPLDKLEEVPGEREVWASLLSLLPPDPAPDNRKKVDG